MKKIPTTTNIEPLLKNRSTGNLETRTCHPSDAGM